MVAVEWDHLEVRTFRLVLVVLAAPAARVLQIFLVVPAVPAVPVVQVALINPAVPVVQVAWVGYTTLKTHLLVAHRPVAMAA